VTAATVLIVENEQLVAKGIRQALLGFGYEVPDAVASGEQAVVRAEELRPGIVLMDIALDGFMDGVAAAAEIRARLGIPVVYLTSHADEATHARATESGAYGYLVKPFDVRALRTAIEVALEKRDLERRMEGMAAPDPTHEIEARPARSEERIAIGGRARGASHEINNALAYVISNVAFSSEGVRNIADKLQAIRVAKGQRGELGDVLARLRDIGEALDDAGEGADRVRRLVRERVSASAAPPPLDRGEVAGPSEEAPPRSPRARLLVIDDDAGLAAAMARLLGLHHDVAIETDPAVALARLGGEERFDVVFCDLMMPSGSGIELYEKLAAFAPDVAARVVFMTGGVFTEEAGAFLDRVPNATLTKPFTLEAVEAMVGRWVPRQGGGAAGV
jgi:CheY-like chemotaxis protein